MSETTRAFFAGMAVAGIVAVGGIVLLLVG